MADRSWRLVAAVILGLFFAGAAAAPPEDRGPPAGNTGFSYRVEIEGFTQGEFADVSGLASSTEVEEFREGGDVERIRKVPGLTRFADIVLAADPASPVLDELWSWRREIMDGTVIRRNGSVIVFDRAGSGVARYSFLRAWPSKWEGPTPKSDDGKVILEKVTITVEFIERQ